ncbi:MAG: hypothetical protein K9K67_09580 [Bacteriovoracaceae bacterium]|nr:hypothetical protein [Bacteriovoracaceae bacterium]
MEIRRKPRGDKIYRGAYNYYKGENLYAEEEFEVYKDRKELGMSFFAEIHSRVATGELLVIYVDFTLTKDYIPQKLMVERTLGELIVKELYDFNPRTNIIDYIFMSKKGQEHKQIQVPPKFSITTPSACTSMLFLKTKKEDPTSKNFFPILSSTNLWSFENIPFQQTVAVERTALASENINIDGHSVSATPYRVFDVIDLDKTEDQDKVPFATTHISKHSTIPYVIRSQDGLRIQIKYLNDLDKD